MIPKHLLSFLFLLLSLSAFANDGAYFAAGNQLIPIHETDISIQKEILTVKKSNNKLIEVTVYYEFFNPSREKELIVGFEAISPSGDVEGAPKKGLHPYMRDFTVNMNGSPLKYQVAYVADSLYNQNGKIKTIDLANFDGNTSGNYVDFFYVYHFKAKFKKGKNIVKHTYTFDVSGGIDYNFQFDYVLTAANRWANKQIDDFTLNIEMEDFEDFYIDKTFFKRKDEWKIEGVGKVRDIKATPNSPLDRNALEFAVKSGKLVFQKKNFSPKGELSIYSHNLYIHEILSTDRDFYLPFSIYQADNINFEESLSSFQKKILRNLPFARRGYVFNDPELKEYYESLYWYMPDPQYSPAISKLHKSEQQWIEQWK